MPTTIKNIEGLFKNCKSILEFEQRANLFYNFFQEQEVNGEIKLTSTEIDDIEITNYNSLFEGCSSLIYIPASFKVLSTVTELKNTFKDCQSLNKISFSLTNNTINLESCFHNCISLTEIGNTFTFSQKTKNLKSVFENCSSLREIPDTLWPNPEFELETTIDFSNAFANCTSASGTVPMYKLWYGEVYWNPSNTNAFAGCENLTNYNYIPINWGGEGEAYTNLDFELTIPEDDKNRTFALPIHKTYTAYDFQVTTNNKKS